ncbi:hypothetical protein BJF78_32045 [Pseudonocardia sp. CNS-139]|nr:hypothetical protein BJF78_32045 [Pseudonocardia sp. CNS-139]
MHRDAVAVDPYRGEVVERITWDDYPWPAQMRELGVELHTGTLFGLANQILLALFAVATVVLIVIGYRMWWKRSPYRGQLPSAPPRALRQAGAPVVVVVGLLVAGIGILLPVLGVSLVLFLVADAVVNAVRRRRARVPVPTQRPGSAGH